MPRYKKKRRGVFSVPKRSMLHANSKKRNSNDIEMSPSNTDSIKNDGSMRVLKGKKKEKGRRFKFGLAVVSVIVAIIMLIEVLLPAGIFQTISNVTAVLGKGTYPISIKGAETLNVATPGNYFFHLTDTYISGYASSGKELFSTAHGFERPVLSTSKGRILVYNLGGKQFHIFDLNELKETVETKQEIICAAISDSGNYAVATYSDKYAAAVTVYNKRGKILFEWYSAEDAINNIAISPNGKKIAISTFNSSSGLFNSKVNIINFKSATPEFSKTIEKNLVYGLKGSNKKGFFVVKSKGTEFIKWSGEKSTEFSDDYNISLFRSCGSKNAVVFCRESDQTDNRIAIITKSGKHKYTLKFKGIINDIRIKGSNVYCLSDNTVSVLDFEGNVKLTVDCGYGGNGLSVLTANTVAVINDTQIKKIKIEG